jgi:hypothetical protein
LMWQPNLQSNPMLYSCLDPPRISALKFPWLGNEIICPKPVLSAEAVEKGQSLYFVRFCLVKYRALTNNRRP